MPTRRDEEHQRERFTQSSMLQQLISDVRGCPYFVLGVPIFSSDNVVKKAYRKLSAQYHPDKSVNATKEVQALNEEKMKSINSAKKFLDSKKWKFIYESYYKQITHPTPFNHSKWSSRLIGKPESSGFASPSSPRRVHSYEDSYDKAKRWIRQKVDRREIEHDRDIVALIIRDILKNRNDQLIELWAKEDWYQQELNEYVQRGILFDTVPIDLVFLKMFEYYPHIFPLTCGFALNILYFDEDQCVIDENNYKSKWSKKKNLIAEKKLYTTNWIL
jgi:curved DNA-binding protein CbpA